MYIQQNISMYIHPSPEKARISRYMYAERSIRGTQKVCDFNQIRGLRYTTGHTTVCVRLSQSNPRRYKTRSMAKRAEAQSRRRERVSASAALVENPRSPRIHPGISRARRWLQIFFDFENGDTVKTDEGDPEELNFKSHGLPLIFRFGIAADPQINEQIQLIISIVGEHPADNLERVNLGAEIRYLNYFCGRAGYIINHDTRGPSFGFGINDIPLMSLGKLDADFAISQFSFFEPVMIFSAGLHF